jgi:heme oxygenase
MVLSRQVREATLADHEYAESRPFITALMAGQLHVRAYVELLAAMAPVYQAMEAQFRVHADEASICLFDHRQLDRFDRIRADLASFGQPAVRQHTLTSTQLYVSAISRAASAPQRLLAHHYTRYLGDMAGGRAVASVLHRTYGIPMSQLSFYDFSGLGDVVHYRRRYKHLLDLVPWTDAERQVFIDEARLAFRLSANVFDDLADSQGLDLPAWSAARFFGSERGHQHHFSDVDVKG